MIDLSTRSANDVIIKDKLPEYQDGMKFFHAQLIHLNITIYILDKILKFPFDLFVPSDKTIFFRTVIRNFFDSGLLVITRLETDQGGDLYTLEKFKAKVRELVRPEFRTDLDARLRKHRFDKSTNELFKKAKLLRDEHIAHTKREFSKGLYLKFSELKSLRDLLCSLLDDLSFNVDHMMLPVAYDLRVEHRAFSDQRSDIEELLEYMAMQSTLLHLPEDNPRDWAYRRTNLTEVQIRQINYYRRKLGLTEV